MGFKPITQTTVQFSTNLAIKPTGSWSLCEILILDDEEIKFINEVSYLWTTERDMENWLIIAVTYRTEAVLKLKLEKISGVNRIRTHDLCYTGAVQKYDFSYLFTVYIS